MTFNFKDGTTLRLTGKELAFLFSKGCTMEQLEQFLNSYYTGELNEKRAQKKRKGRTGRKVVAILSNGEVVNFNSITDAGLHFKINPVVISTCLKRYSKKEGYEGYHTKDGAVIMYAFG